MIKNKEIFDVNPLDPEVLQTHIHNQLVNIVHNIELQTDKLYDAYKENKSITSVYPIRVKILEEKKYLELLIETLDMAKDIKMNIAKKAAN
tara:strand:- start:68 stop:340 length:273 start_codon:yes stop_codon:yes gene_type:complete